MTLDPVIAATLSLAFGVLFGFAVIHKVADFPAYLITVRKYLRDGIFDRELSARVLGVIILLVELSLAIACALPWTRRAAGGIAAAVLAVYAAAMYVNLRRGNVLLDCGCAWGTRHQPVTRALVLRNLALAALALPMMVPAGPGALAPIDFFSIAAAAVVCMLFYSALNLLLAHYANTRGAR